jgi:hypothetical protein
MQTMQPMINAFDILKTKLPEHIVQHIISYTYQVQRPKLLMDIQNFYVTRNILFETASIIYTTRYLYNYINWFQKDYTGSYYRTFLRLYMLDYKDDVLLFKRRIECLPPNSQINILWGLMKHYERKEFLSILLYDVSSNIENSDPL